METIIYTVTITEKKLQNDGKYFRFEQSMHFKKLESALDHMAHWIETKGIDFEPNLLNPGKNHYYGTGENAKEEFTTLELCETLLF